MKLRITPLFPVKRFAAMAAACVMLVSVAACGSKSDSGATVNPGEAIISVNNTEPQSPLVPADTNEMGGGKVIRYLFEGLVSYDVNGKQHLEVAKSITPNDDASQFTIVINDGWKFTNGEAVTASSFADAWSYAANVKHAMKQASRMSIIKGYDELQDPNVSDDAKLSGLRSRTITHWSSRSTTRIRCSRCSWRTNPSSRCRQWHTRTSRRSARTPSAMARTSSSPGMSARASRW